MIPSCSCIHVDLDFRLFKTLVASYGLRKCHNDDFKLALCDLLLLFAVDISNLTAIRNAMPENILSPTLAAGEVKMTVAIMMVMTGFVKPLVTVATRQPTTSAESLQSQSSTSNMAKVGTKRKLPSSFQGNISKKFKKGKGKKFW